MGLKTPLFSVFGHAVPGHKLILPAWTEVSTVWTEPGPDSL